MDRRVQVALVATVLLSGGGQYLYLHGGLGSYQQDEVRVEVQVAKRRGNLEDCLYAAQMMFDVHWAVACTTQGASDDSAECDLPDPKAAVVNGWLNEAEQRCMAEARGGGVPR